MASGEAAESDVVRRCTEKHEIYGNYYLNLKQIQGTLRARILFAFDRSSTDIDSSLAMHYLDCSLIPGLQ